MKKLFTLIAVALVALSANAKTDVDFSGISENGVVTFAGGWEWKGLTQSSGSLIEDADAKTADDKDLVYFDASAHDYLILKYSSATCAVNFVIQYKCTGTIGQWGAEWNTDQVTIAANPNGGMAAIKLGEQKNTVNSIALQNQNDAGELVVTEFFWASEAEYEAAKADADQIEKVAELSGEYTSNLVAGDWGWDGSWLDMDVTDYNALVYEVESVEGKGQVIAQGKDAADADVNATIVFDAEGGVYAYDITEWTKILQYAYQNINVPEGKDDATAADISATTIKVKRVYLTSKKADEIVDGISAVKVAKTQNNVMYNLAGQQVAPSYKGIVIMNGKKFVNK